MHGTAPVTRAGSHRLHHLQRRVCAIALLGLVACTKTPHISSRDAADANDTGSKLTAATESDRLLLSELPKLPVQAARRVGDKTILAEAPYVAASGRTCRAIHVVGAASQAGSKHRLACSNGSGWFFVPDVLGSSGE